ncbi:ATPase, T2SS/T4P/T4SS family [Neptunomonas sp. XY-337]|uniref:GspE/PulE family protein n=1 Tax=Neptunomonas sp. XY-337 TaxID=2561897 RepID=UPI0010AAA112|nr:ATPase, T2SS/T4P/T4SS family [Neptunomonas sp. XY-337]
MKLAVNDIKLDANDVTFAVSENTLDTGDSAVAIHNDTSVPVYLNKTLLNAIEAGASDIHFEPYEESFRVRFRIDGVMQEIAEMPKGFGHLICARLKVIAGLDISEQRIAQGGRFKMLITGTRGIDFRCSVLPTMHGETIVLRLLYLPEEILDLNTLGLEPEQIVPLKSAINQLQGMILITGPTGSGKTVTLYTLIKHINQQPRNIYTVEDPVEIDLSGVNQISIGERITFAEASRTIMRQDPDVIMLGEMRDRETIDTAIKAAHTGHLVLSTLHANTAPKAIPRLLNMGVPNYDIASTVTLVVSQRLLRRLDPNTREQIAVPKRRLLALGFREDEIDDNLVLYRARPAGNQTGYSGRIGVFQVMPVNETLSRMIAGGASDASIDDYLVQQGTADMRRSALNKVKAGITDIDEVERVLGFVENYHASPGHAEPHHEAQPVLAEVL